MRLILFAKAPIPGYAKTRLMPALGGQGAARFHQTLVRHCLSSLCSVSAAAVELHYSEPHPFFWRLAKRFHCRLYPQSAGNLGQRMLNALQQEQTPAIIVGSDCPVITPDLLRRCVHALKDSDVVLLPAEDGGYGLIGSQHPHHPELEKLFEAMPWGTSEVLASTRRAVHKTRLRLQELDTVWDIDTPEDLQRWRQFNRSA